MKQVVDVSFQECRGCLKLYNRNDGSNFEILYYKYNGSIFINDFMGR